VQLAFNHLLRMVRSNVLEISTSRLAKISALSGSSSLNGKPVMIACSGGFRIFFRLADVQFLTNIANVARVKRGGTKRIDFAASSMGCGSSATRGMLKQPDKLAASECRVFLRKCRVDVGFFEGTRHQLC